MTNKNKIEHSVTWICIFVNLYASSLCLSIVKTSSNGKLLPCDKNFGERGAMIITAACCCF